MKHTYILYWPNDSWAVIFKNNFLEMNWANEFDVNQKGSRNSSVF